MNNAPIELFVDFLSPYGYLGARQLVEVAPRYGREIDWKPFLLGVTVMRTMGLPAVPDTPLKGAYAAHDIPRLFRYFGLDYNPPQIEGQIGPLVPDRSFYWVKTEHPDKAQAFGLKLYERAFLEAVDIGQPGNVADLAEEMGMDGKAMIAAIETDGIKAMLRATTEDMIARNLFGSPTIVVDGEPFWGSDRVWLVEEWLKRGGW
jgi:2-hydroxychromene-2-carboxylate isomerase